MCSCGCACFIQHIYTSIASLSALSHIENRQTIGDATTANREGKEEGEGCRIGIESTVAKVDAAGNTVRAFVYRNTHLHTHIYTYSQPCICLHDYSLALNIRTSHPTQPNHPIAPNT